MCMISVGSAVAYYLGTKVTALERVLSDRIISWDVCWTYLFVPTP